MRPGVVVHLAALLPGASDDLDEVNVEGTRRVADAAASVGARLVFASSAAVYASVRESPAREDEAVAPTTPYGRSKVRAEEVLDAFGDAVT
ncbi:NAD-dependent epimerase/dehydratase family protein, partial [Schumannella luteola]